MQQLDEFWLNLTLGMIGEIIDPADEITGDARALLPRQPPPNARGSAGARIVDKSVNARCMYRLELWFKRKDQATADELLSAQISFPAPRESRLAQLSSPRVARRPDEDGARQLVDRLQMGVQAALRHGTIMRHWAPL